MLCHRGMRQQPRSGQAPGDRLVRRCGLNNAVSDRVGELGTLLAVANSLKFDWRVKWQCFILVYENSLALALSVPPLPAARTAAITGAVLPAIRRR